MDVGVGVVEEEEDAEVRRMLVARARGHGFLAAADAASSPRQEADEGESCLHIALCRPPVWYAWARGFVSVGRGVEWMMMMHGERCASRDIRHGWLRL